MTAQHKVVSHDEWTEARKALLAGEKEFSRQREALAPAPRAALGGGRQGLRVRRAGREADPARFVQRLQPTLVYHFMFPPDWDAGCPHCSFWADSFNGVLAHLRARDVSTAAVSRAPIGKIAAYKQRMGWSFRWVSAGETDFNYDFGVAFSSDQVAGHAPVYNYGSEPGFEDREGISVFARDEQGRVFRTYSTYARGIDMMNAAYQYLDLVPKGRDEPSGGDPQFWVRRHDEYGS